MVVSLNTTDCKALVTVPNACAPCKQVPIQNVVWRRGWGREGDVLKLKLQLNRMGLLYRWPCVQQYTGESGNQCKFCCTGRWASLWKRRATHTHTHTQPSAMKTKTEQNHLNLLSTTHTHTWTYLNIRTWQWNEKKRKEKKPCNSLWTNSWNGGVGPGVSVSLHPQSCNPVCVELAKGRGNLTCNLLMGTLHRNLPHCNEQYTW